MNAFIITTATALMIKDYRVDTTYDSLTLSWSTPEYLPEVYKWDVSCMLLCQNTVYIGGSGIASPLETKHYSPKLHPGSRCVTKFLAIYNPASLDAGLTNTVYTKEKGEQYTYVYSLLSLEYRCQ